MNTTECVAVNRFTEQFGHPNERVATKVKSHMTAYVQEFIRCAPFAVMATSDRDGRCDASPKGGRPGFVQVLDDSHLLFPDVAGNRLFQSYQNMDSNPHIGLVFFIPGVNDTVRVNGKVIIVDQEALNQRKIEVSLHNPDDRAKYLQGIVIEVEESYGHCPRALQFSQLWDAQEILSNQANRPISVRPTSS